MPARQTEPVGQRSWRDSKALAEAKPFRGSKRPLRVLLALSIVGLVAWLGWLLFQPIKLVPPTYFVALTTGETKRLSMPPVLYERETLEPLEELVAEDGYEGSLRSRPGAIGESASVLKSLALEEGDRLVVYVSAHGVSDGGNGYLLAEGYDLHNPQAARVTVTDLLDQVAGLKAATKLVVFDCSRLAASPRMGVALNEFATIATEAARATGDKSLWVMLAGGELETSPMGLAERRSALGAALVAALVDAADPNECDRNGDRDISLAELDEFVASQCARFPTAAPAPQLVYCGLDQNAGDKQAIISRLSSPVRAKARNDEAPGDESKAKEKDSAKPSLATAAKVVAKPVAAAQASAAGKLKPVVESAVKSGGTQSPEAAAAVVGNGAAAKETVGAPPAGASDSSGAPVEAAPATSPQELAAGSGATAPPSPEAKPSSGPEAVAAPAATPDQPVADASAPAATKKEDELLTPIAKTWRLRDALLQEGGSDELQPLPVDYAPHLWNELNATLVSLEIEQLGQSDAERAADDSLDDLIQQYLAGLERLTGQASSTSGGTQLTERLLLARDRFLASDELRALRAMPLEYARALLQWRRALYRSYQYVQWHAVAHADPSDAGAMSSEVARTVGEILDRLATMDEQLASLEERRLDEWADADGFIRDAGQVTEDLQQLDRRVTAEVASLLSDDGPAVQRRREIFLATDLLNAAQRAAIAAAATKSAVADQTAREPSRPRWSAAIEHLQLETKLVQLVDPATRRSEAFDAVRRAGGALDGNSPATRALFRRAGNELRDFYGRLPGELVNHRRAGAGPQEQRIAEKLATVMHPIDAFSEGGNLGSANAFVTSRVRPPSQLELTPPAATTISVDRWTKLQWLVEMRDMDEAVGEAVLEGFDDRALEVRFGDETENAKPGDSRALDGGESQSILLNVRARRQGEGTVESRTRQIQLAVKLKTAAGAREESSSARAVLPRPNRLDLAAYCVEPRLRPELRGDDGLVLRPFPHRDTAFQFELTNQSGAAKNVVVQLLAVPAIGEQGGRGADGWPTGWLLDVDNLPAPRLQQWAEGDLSGAAILAECNVSLPAEEKPQLLNLQPPPKPAEEKPEEKPAGAEGAAGAAPPAAEPPPAIDVTHGLLCRIVNQQSPQEVWLKWIEVVPRRPANYVTLRGWHDPNVREIHFTANSIDLDGDGRVDAPPGLAKSALPVVVYSDGVFLPPGNVVPDQIDPAKSEARLDLTPAETAPKRHMLEVAIDGFPRADAWRIDLDSKTVERVRDRRSVVIERLGMNKNDVTPGRLYLTAPQSLATPIDPKAWDAVIDAAEDKICAFDISRGPRPIDLKLRVDAPLDSFNAVSGGDRVVVEWDVPGEVEDAAQVRLFDDRDVQSRLAGITPEGGLLIASSVDDFTLSLLPRGANRKSLQLSARLYITGDLASDDRLQVIFDGEAPEITVALDPREFPVGTRTLPAKLTVKDVSGAGLVEAWVFDKPPEGPEALDPKKAFRFEKPDRSFFQPGGDPLARLTIPIPAEKMMPGDYLLIVRATDRSGQSRDTFATPIPFKISPPPPVDTGPITADLTGVVMLGTKPAQPGLKVYVKEQPALAGSTMAGGKFVIKSVKAGSYTLLVEGDVKNRPAKGEQAVVLAEKKDYQNVLINAEWKLADPPPKK